MVAVYEDTTHAPTVFSDVFSEGCFFPPDLFRLARGFLQRGLWPRSGRGKSKSLRGPSAHGSLMT